MSNTFGKAIKITLFGESHGPAVGAVVDGLPPGLRIDKDRVNAELAKRSGLESVSTARREPDEVEFLSGEKDGYTQGTPLTIVIRNTAARPGDYEKTAETPRPSHADYTGYVKYLGFADASGGGHFSGRLTAPLVAAGAILQSALEEKGISIGTHISRLHGISDRAFADDPAEDIKTLKGLDFPALDLNASEKMIKETEAAKAAGDSVGGTLETAVCGLEAGLGEPWFDSIESELAHILFSIPAVKGVEFGEGFAMADKTGSEANDEPCLTDGRISMRSNNGGGADGGITNGMPLLFRTAVKPTPSIAMKQNTVDLAKGEETTVEIKGRHDPAIVHRAAPVVNAAAALVIADFIARRFGYMALRNE